MGKTLTERMEPLTESLSKRVTAPMVCVAKQKLGGNEEMAGIHLSFYDSNSNRYINVFLPAAYVARFYEAVERNTRILGDLELL